MTIEDYRGHETPREAFAKYRRDGFALFPKLFSDAEVDELKIRAMLGRGDDQLRREQRGARGVIVHWSAAVDPALDALRSAARLLDIVAGALETIDIRQYGQQICCRDPAGTAAIAWHRDEIDLASRIADPRRNSVALALYLDDVLDQDQGAVLYVPGSHEWEADSPVDWPDGGRCEAMMPRRGMVGLWNAGTIHGSRPNTTRRDRRSLMHGYVRADATADPAHLWAWKGGRGLSHAEATALG